jgi:CubicO group peptidase (beta-lactamase class C family)/D-alanyl-D-alanine dipeptidase
MRAALLLGTLALLVLLVRSGPWLSDKLAVYEHRTAVQDSLDAFIQLQMADKEIPGLSVSLISGQRVRLERGYGLADPLRGEPATEYTVYRVGALSQAFTTVAILERAERGLVQLDAPVDSYLPDFHPLNPFGHPITLRQLLSHQSGLPREPHVGHTFDPTQPTLAATVASLNDTRVVYPPETFTKYSNAAFAVAGYVLEYLQQKPYEQHLRAVLDRMDLKRTSFASRFDLRSKLARGHRWAYDGRPVQAPTYEPGAMPALSLYTTANDLGRFLRVLFAGGESPNGAILSPAAIEELATRQPATPRQETPYGLAFVVDDHDGERRIHIDDSFQGFTARLDALPDRKAGIAVTANIANANAILERIADYAFALLRAEQAGEPLPPVPTVRPIPLPVRDRYVGRYVGPTGEVTISEMAGEVYACQDIRRTRLRLAGQKDTLIADDRHTFGAPLFLLPNGSLHFGADVYTRREPAPPVLVDADLLAYVGIYGNEEHALFVLERDGQLVTLLDWIRFFTLTRAGTPDTFAFPDEGMFGGESAYFDRDSVGLVRRVTLANMTFERLADPSYPVPSSPLPARTPSSDATSVNVPPRTAGPARTPTLVDITLVDPLLYLDIRYATEDNIFGQAYYDEPRALLEKPVSDALFRVQEAIRPRGYGLIVYDAYRPWHHTRAMWEATPDSLRHFFDPPSRGGHPNRGCAVSLNLYDLDTGLPLAMPTAFDALVPEAAAGFPIIDSRLRWNRDYLRYAMEREGFAVHPFKWWLFEHRTCPDYPVLDESFADIDRYLYRDESPPADFFTIDP